MKTDKVAPNFSSNVASHKRFPIRVYIHRIIGMALAGLPVAVIFHQNNATSLAWAWWFFGCFLWPHLAFLKAKNSKDSFISERGNFTFDSFIAGSFIPMIEFNLLPSVILISLGTADKINSGIRKLWAYGIVYSIVGIGIGCLVFGVNVDLNSNFSVIVAVLPLMVLHTMAVSISSYFLIRSVFIKNQKLDILSRKDPLTQLYNCRVWQESSEELFIECKNKNLPISLFLIDIDNFKSVNDNYGHSIGDELLNSISQIISVYREQDGIVGRIGGDELSLVLPITEEKALSIGDEILRKVDAIELQAPESIKTSVSIGLVTAYEHCENFRDWFDRADKALYQAKRLGRNRLNKAE